MVTRNDGEIIYLNRPFQATFPGFLSQPVLNLPTLLTMQGATQEDTEKLLAILATNQHASHSMTLKAGDDNSLQNFVLSIEPVGTPRGYTMIRAK